MSIQKSTVPMTVRSLVKKKDRLRFDLAIQRNTVWTVEQKSMFIHTLIYGFPFPPVYALDEGDDQLWFLDGKQRLSTVIAFVQDGFKLSDKTPEIVTYAEGEDAPAEGTPVTIAGKYFSDLQEDFRDEILSTNFSVVQLRGLTENERDEMFYRLNNGSPLKAIELTRVLASSHVMAYIKELSHEKFFAKSVALTESGRNRFVDEEMIMQIIALVEANRQSDGKELVPIDISGKSLKQFAISKKQAGISDEVKEIVNKVTAYLGEAFPVQDTFLKKVHVPMLFMMAWKYAIPNDITSAKFAGWAQTFFAKRKRGDKYMTASSAGSAKADNVRKRLESMGTDYAQNIFDAKDYVIPEPKIGKNDKKDIQDAVAQAEEAEKQAASAKAQENKEKSSGDAEWTGENSGDTDGDSVDQTASDIVSADKQGDEQVGADPAESENAKSDVVNA